MQKRTLKVAILAVLATVLLLSFSSVVLADQTWSDLPDTVTAKYGLTDNQVAAISEGFAGGLWKPYQSVNRAQFTKMAVAAFNIPLADPATASFTDVPKGSYYYPYIEGAKAAAAVNGTTASTFSPNADITRQQAIAIVARYIAKAQGFDLATMYTAAEVDLLLAHFGDVASISADLKDDVAFAYDMGLTNGDDFGNINPLANLTRIQGAALLIRAQALVPPNLWVPAKIEQVGADKTEGLIGQVASITYKVTTADGHPAIGVLVDFDSLAGAKFYVGNVTQQAAVTNNLGEVTVDVISAEPGTQRVSASVVGVGTIYTTRYWLVLDEVYNLKGGSAQNNAGVEHEWAVRVVVFGPGPRSTSQGDWYNAISTLPFDPTNINVDDGVDYTCHPDNPEDFEDIEDGWDISYELDMADYDLKPRTLAGIDVQWALYDVPDDPKTKLTNEAIVSVGKIINVDGTAITPAKTAVGKTNADGLSSIKVYSEVVGKTLTEAVADYAGNPYPEQLFNHETFQDWQWHDVNWDDQPNADSVQEKTWIAHTIGAAAGPISPAYQAPNIGEEEILTITLKDVYGNPVAGKYVEWFMQGVGFFQTDDAGDTSDPSVAANNKDFDVTDAQGKATLFVKSYNAGEQIIHAKVRDKGIGGAEGSFMTYTAEVQWFDADIATFDDITTVGQWVWDFDFEKYFWVDNNEAVSQNAVNGSHTFDLRVYGLKLEYDPTVDEPDGQTPYIDSDAAGSSYDGIIDAKDAKYFGGILMYPMGIPRNVFADKLRLLYPVQGDWTNLPYDENGNGIIERNNSDNYDERGTFKIKVAGVWLTLSFEGAYTMYDYDDDAYKEWFFGIPGIYLPLEGKTVTFTKANQYKPGYSNLNEVSVKDLELPWIPDIPNNFYGMDVAAVGAFTPATAVTDAAGKASVTVTSTVKGPETIKATVDWANNPHNGPELLTAYAKKNWVAGTVAAATDVTIEIWIDGVKVATNKAGELAEPAKAAWTEDPANGDLILNSAHVEVHVKDAYGNDLPDYEVVYLLESIDSWLDGSQQAADTFIPWAYLVDKDIYNDNLDAAENEYDQNGNRPDADEPMPSSDPYAYIVGPGGTESFFFNQWLGSEKPTYAGQPGLAKWWTRAPVAIPGYAAQFGDYLSARYLVNYTYTWPRPWLNTYPSELFDPFNGVLENGGPVAPEGIGLATDGAKAWTLDGYMNVGQEGNVEIVPNLLTGSNIDIQLAEDLRGASEGGVHVKSILRVMVYAPADGLVQEGAYIWSTQVHQVWEEPRVASITLSPATDFAIAGEEQQQLVATVLDQFGEPMPNVELDVYSTVLEGQDYSADTSQDLSHFASEQTPLPTDANGQTAIEWYQSSGDWGVEEVYFSDGDVDSNDATIQWVYWDDQGNWDLTDAYDGEQKVYVWDSEASDAGWNGRVIKPYLNPQGSLAGALGFATFVSGVDLTISTNLHTWIEGEFYFLGAASTNTDNVPNWVWEEVGYND